MNISDTIELSSNNLELLALAVNEYEKIIEVKKELDLLVIKLKEDTSTFDLNNYLVSKGIVLSPLAVRRISLEDQFLELLKENA